MSLNRWQHLGIIGVGATNGYQLSTSSWFQFDAAYYCWLLFFFRWELQQSLKLYRKKSEKFNYNSGIKNKRKNRSVWDGNKTDINGVDMLQSVPLVIRLPGGYFVLVSFGSGSPIGRGCCDV